MNCIPLEEKETHSRYQANDWYSTSNVRNNLKCKLYISADFLYQLMRDLT